MLSFKLPLDITGQLHVYVFPSLSRKEKVLINNSSLDEIFEFVADTFRLTEGLFRKDGLLYNVVAARYRFHNLRNMLSFRFKITFVIMGPQNYLVLSVFSL